jgi:histidine triad (HIT) family protein
MTDECLFCRIASGEIDAHVVHDDARILASLDRGPIRPGHTQIVPKQHFAYFDDAPADIVTAIVLLGQSFARAMKRLYGVPRVAFLFSGGDVAHVHAHVIPMHERTDVTSRRYIIENTVTFRSMLPAPDSELAQTAAELRRALAEMDGPSAAIGVTAGALLPSPANIR